MKHSKNIQLQPLNAASTVSTLELTGDGSLLWQSPTVWKKSSKNQEAASIFRMQMLHIKIKMSLISADK